MTASLRWCRRETAARAADAPTAPVVYHYDDVSDLFADGIVDPGIPGESERIVSVIRDARPLYPTTFPDDDGAITHLEMSFAGLGDSSIAIRGSHEGDNVPGSIVFVAAAIDDKLVVFAGTGAGAEIDLFDRSNSR